MTQRIKRLKQRLVKDQLDAYFSEVPLDIFYLLEFKVSKGMLLILDGNTYLFLDDRYREVASSLSDVTVLFYSLQNLEEMLKKKRGRLKVAFPGSKMSYARVCELKESVFLDCELVNSEIVEELRMIKETKEIEAISQACKITTLGFQTIESLIGSDLSESEMAKKFYLTVIEQGAGSLAFDTHVAFDRHASMPHYYHSNNAKSKTQEVLIDAGCVFNHYCSDRTRTILLKGASSQLKDFHAIVMEGYHFLLDTIQIGITFQLLHDTIVAHFRRYGMDHLFIHALGHGVGLEIHEPPFFRRHPSSQLMIQENMVFAIEPGLYDPKIGGVRFENTIWMSPNGPIELTK